MKDKIEVMPQDKSGPTLTDEMRLLLVASSFIIIDVGRLRAKFPEEGRMIGRFTEARTRWKPLSQRFLISSLIQDA